MDSFLDEDGMEYPELEYTDSLDLSDSLVGSQDNRDDIGCSTEELGLLLAEIVPGITHRANDLLMEISGCISLAKLKQSQGLDGSHILADLPDRCELLMRLFEKMVSLSRLLEKKGGDSDILECLKLTINIVHNLHPSNAIQLCNQTEEESRVRGDFSRLCHGFKLILESLIDTGRRGIFHVSVTSDSPVPEGAFQDKNTTDSQWIRIAFQPEGKPLILGSPEGEFYNPNKPFEFSDCRLAAAENIIRAYNGRMDVNAEGCNRIDVYLPKG